MKRKLALICLLCCVVAGFRPGDGAGFVVPPNFPEPVYDFSKNPLSEQKIQLGRKLFYDPTLSRNNAISCASCHSQFAAFTHADHALSHGIDDKIGTRNAPALMNLAWQRSYMRDGSINHLDMQALAPLSNPIEMDMTITRLVGKLQGGKIYPKLFYEAFGDSMITGEHLLKALSQFMLTLVSANSKYDSVMRGQAAYTAQEEKGYALFKKNCASCHVEPLFTNNDFKNIGLSADTTLYDLGRYTVTKNPEDSFKFRVPTLRNIEFSYPYMHDGRFKRLQEVLNYYTSGIVHVATLAKELQQPIILSSNDKVDITAFLLTLSDRSFIFNTQYSYPRNAF